jgi:hypothetical protein
MERHVMGSSLISALLISDVEISNGTPTVKKVMRFASQVEKLLLKLKEYGDEASVKELEAQNSQIKHMLDAIGCATDGGEKESTSFEWVKLDTNSSLRITKKLHGSLAAIGER